MIYDELLFYEPELIVGILNAEQDIAARQLNTIHWTEIPNFEYIGHINYD